MKYELRTPESRWKVASLASIVVTLAAVVPLHNAYVGWHDERYAKRTEVILLAQATRLEQQIQIAQTTSQETSEKVDQLAQSINNIEISTAISALSSLQMELSRHEFNRQNTQEWRDKKDELILQIQRAEDYKQCLIENRRNCDIFRPW